MKAIKDSTVAIGKSADSAFDTLDTSLEEAEENLEKTKKEWKIKD